MSDFADQRGDDSDQATRSIRAEETANIKLPVGYACVLTGGWAMVYAAKVTPSRYRRSIYVMLGCYCLLVLLVFHVLAVMLLTAIFVYDPTLEPPPVTMRTAILYGSVTAAALGSYLVIGFSITMSSIRRAQRTGKFRLPLIPGALVNAVESIFVQD